MIEPAYDIMPSLLTGSMLGAVGWFGWGMYRGWIYDEREKGNKVGLMALVRCDRQKKDVGEEG